MIARQRITAVTLVVLVQLLGLRIAAPQQAPDTADTDQAATNAAEAAYARAPLAFEPNVGQADESVDFLVHHGQAVTAFSSTGTTTSVGGKQVTMSLTGAAVQDFAGTDELPSKTNYFLGNDQSKWQSDIPNYGKLVANNVYPGIDLAYYGTNSQLEHDFIVAPGVDYRQIAFGFTGQDDLSLDGDGNLILKAGDDTLTLNAPVTYQTDTNSKHTIPSSFELNDGTVTVAVADTYDPAKPLIIDPVLVLHYGTYFGGTGNEQSFGMEVDGAGNMYIAGETASSDLPIMGAYDGSYSAGNDGFVSKFSSDGATLLYSTYLGGAGFEQLRGLRVDTGGNAYVGGTTGSTDYPTTAGAFQTVKAGTNGGFVTKLDPTGGSLVYSTYVGESPATDIQVINIDDDGNVYMGGATGNNNALATPGAFQTTLSDGGITNDAWLGKLNPSGSALVFATYLGGNGSEWVIGIAVDDDQNVYATGRTSSSNFPMASAYDGSHNGGVDGFVAKFNPTGSSLLYSTYFGGAGDDEGDGIVLGTGGDIYVTGITQGGFPTVAALQPTYGGGAYDAFLIKLDPTGAAPVFSTYLGGSGLDAAYRLLVDDADSVYLSGRTDSTNFPILGAFQASNGGSADGFLTKFAPDGSSITFSSYVGGSGFDQIAGLYLRNHRLYASGWTDSANFPTATPFQASIAGGTDAFIAEFLVGETITVTGTIDPTLEFALDDTTCNMGTFNDSYVSHCTHGLHAGSNAPGGYVVSYVPTTTLTSGPNTIDAMAVQDVSNPGTEQFGMNLVANSGFGFDPYLGTGVALAGYDTPDEFTFAVGGDPVAYTAGPSLTTFYNASFIANITSVSEAGTYATLVTYTIVANY